MVLKHHCATRRTAPRVFAAPRAAPPRNESLWSVLALAAAQEARELAECEQARLRQIIERFRAINPVMTRHIAGDPPPGYPSLRWSWSARS